jgi:hypothetical protein
VAKVLVKEEPAAAVPVSVVLLPIWVVPAAFHIDQTYVTAAVAVVVKDKL